MNPGEVEGPSLGLTLADIQAAIPEAKSMLPYTPSRWPLGGGDPDNRGYVMQSAFFADMTVPNTACSLNYKVTLGGASVNFTTEIIIKDGGGETTPGFVYST